MWNYALPVTIFAFCYGRIFHTIRRQSKVVAGHAGRTQDVPMATTSRDPNTGQVQQQATGATTDHQKLSHTELNVIKTMVGVIVCFIICWTPAAFAVMITLIMVSLLHTCNRNSLLLLIFRRFSSLRVRLTSVYSAVGNSFHSNLVFT